MHRIKYRASKSEDCNDGSNTGTCTISHSSVLVAEHMPRMQGDPASSPNVI